MDPRGAPHGGGGPRDDDRQGLSRGAGGSARLRVVPEELGLRIEAELPCVLVDLARLPREESFSDVLRAFLRDDALRQSYPNTCTLMRICLVIPLGTASVERAFSLLGVVFGELQKTMHQHTLRKYMFLNKNMGPLTDA